MDKETLEALLGTQEDLDPELEEYLEESALFGACIKHPLVFSIAHAPFQNALVNRQLEYKREEVQRAYARRKWHTYVYLHERPYRMWAFESICRLMGDQEYWETLGGVWTDSENIYQNEREWKTLLRADRPGRELMMSEDERLHLGTYDEVGLPVYRGFSIDGRQRGLSWTANAIVAKWFAKRFEHGSRKPRIASGLVDRKDVIAFFNGRSEYEMVILPHHVRDVKIREVS